MRRCSPYCAPVAVCVVTVVTAVRGCVTEPLSPKNSAASPGFTAGDWPLSLFLLLCFLLHLLDSGKGKSFDWNSTFHDLQLCFGVKEFLVCGTY
ncbi:uncharacterized protein LOC107630993 isoform X4 [Arachis ipaensis]|uniref:uncharacterized protein LOC107630993 isoform X4 n=1 Tax=Arachis ipaensis TaxID=130454 RepID=UPI000A2B4EB3|nr:uncharacterized protein LOC107630993 isoform X4 [Arachis ipaensis]XP_025628953.1 uncharacterized protein LOC112722193 isoform X4 [Arachis hypogaea]